MAIAQTMADVSNLLTTVQDTINGKYGDFMKKIADYQQEIADLQKESTSKSSQYIEIKRRKIEDKISQIQEQAGNWKDEQIKKAQAWITNKLSELGGDATEMVSVIAG